MIGERIIVSMDRADTFFDGYVLCEVAHPAWKTTARIVAVPAQNRFVFLTPWGGKSQPGTMILSSLKEAIREVKFAIAREFCEVAADLSCIPYEGWRAGLICPPSEPREVGYHCYCSEDEDGEMISYRVSHRLLPDGGAEVIGGRGGDQTFSAGRWMLQNTYGNFGSHGGMWVTEYHS